MEENSKNMQLGGSFCHSFAKATIHVVAHVFWEEVGPLWLEELH